MSDRATEINTLDLTGDVINPATEEKQDNIITLLEQGVDNFLINVSLGNVPGVAEYSFGGNNPNVGAGATESLWSQGGIIPDLSTGTQLYASSSSTEDDQVWVVSGVDKDGSGNITRATAIVVLNGQTQVALSTTLWKVYTMLNITPTESLGDIYIAETDTLSGGVPTTTSKIQGKALIGKQAEAIGHYATPTDKISYAFQQDEAVGKAQDMQMEFKNRFPGSTWVEIFPFPAYQNSPNRFQAGFIIDDGGELRMDASSIGGGASVTATYKILEFDV